MGFFDDMAKKVGSVANEAGSKAKTLQILQSFQLK